jgi:hypothetical protein
MGQQWRPTSTVCWLLETGTTGAHAGLPGHLVRVGEVDPAGSLESAEF